MNNKYELIYEGKAKKVFSHDDDDKVIIEFKDDATAFNSLKKAKFEGKGKLNCLISSRIFELLVKNNIPTHFLELKNENTTIGFVRFNEKGEVEYIFVNPIFRKQGLATKLLELVKEKTGKEIILQEPISPLGSKLLKSLNRWK